MSIVPTPSATTAPVTAIRAPEAIPIAAVASASASAASSTASHTSTLMMALLPGTAGLMSAQTTQSPVLRDLCALQVMIQMTRVSALLLRMLLLMLLLLAVMIMLVLLMLLLVLLRVLTLCLLLALLFICCCRTRTSRLCKGRWIWPVGSSGGG